MSDATLQLDQIKELLKSGIDELLQDNRAVVFGFLLEIFEEVPIERAIVDGESSNVFSRETIFQLSEPKEMYRYFP